MNKIYYTLNTLMIFISLRKFEDLFFIFNSLSLKKKSVQNILILKLFIIKKNLFLIKKTYQIIFFKNELDNLKENFFIKT